MPTYTFRNKQTGDTVDKIMSWSSRQEYLAANPDMEAVICGASIVSAVNGTTPPSGFRDVLKTMKNKHPKSHGLDHLV